MKNNVNVSVQGIGFFGLLTILFIGLKLTSVIDWCWMWVVSPLWLPITVVVGIGLFISIIVLFVRIMKVIFKKKITKSVKEDSTSA